MENRDSAAMDLFKCTIRDRAAFETGIKMGTIYHQFVGTPFDKNSVESLEKAISKAIEVQPYVKQCTVNIDRSVIPEKNDTYSYVSLTGEMISADLVTKVENVEIHSKLEYRKELGYPLMYITEIKDA